MSTNISSRILRSSRFKRLQAIPWETLLHIFSYCDQPTLVAVSLASFACWELVGPILYQDVKIVDLDGLASLFFIEIIPSSPRLRSATHLLSRIRTLSIDVDHWYQTTEPLFLHPDLWEEEEDNQRDVLYEFDLEPHRLHSLTDQPLRIRQLLLREWFALPTERIRTFLPYLVFPLLNPQELVHLVDPKNGDPRFDCLGSAFSPFFLHQWAELQRIINEGEDVVCCYYPPEGFTEVPLVSFWAKIPREERRRIEIVFDVTSLPSSFLERMGYGQDGTERDLGDVLDPWRALEETSGLVDLTVILRVREGEDERVAREEVADLASWMKKLVRVEVI